MRAALFYGPTGPTQAASISYINVGTGVVSQTLQAKLRQVRKDFKDFSCTGDGVTNDTVNALKCVTDTGGYAHFSAGTYVLDGSLDIAKYGFTSDDNVFLKIDGVTYNFSNSMCGPLCWRALSSTNFGLIHAISGSTIITLQDGGAGTATGFRRGLSILTDSHCIQMQPATNGGSNDLMWQRSTLNADPSGNRFNITFNESIDRMDFSCATTASGAPGFDSYLQIVAGVTPSVNFPAVKAQFNQGLSVKQRSAGGFQIDLVPISSTVTKLQQVGGSATEFMRFGDNSLGFFGAAGGGRPTITGSRAGNVALANLLANLAALGLVTDSTTA